MCKGCYACVLNGENYCPLKDDRVTLYYGKNEDVFYYKLLARSHIKNKKAVIIDFDEGIKFENFDSVVEVFGDRSVIAISTKGHTKDHIAYLIDGEIPYLIVGDAELTKEAVNKGLYVNSDYGKKGEADARESADDLREFIGNHDELKVFYSHDV